LMLVLVISLNWLLIPKYGLNGAGFATFLSQLILNIIRWVFLKENFNLQPFNKDTLKGFVLFSLSVIYALLIQYLVKFESTFLKSVIALLPIIICYYLVIRYTNNAPDLKDRLNTYYNKVREILT